MSCFQCSSFVPYCYDELKPVIGMSSDSLDAVEEFYKTYAHVAGFAVSIRAQAKVLDVVVNKRFFCMRQGFMRKKNSNIAPVGKKRKPKMQSEGWLSTPWPIEKQVSILYMHHVFKIFILISLHCDCIGTKVSTSYFVSLYSNGLSFVYIFVCLYSNALGCMGRWGEYPQCCQEGLSENFNAKKMRRW
jgi:hypothetical protein